MDSAAHRILKNAVTQAPAAKGEYNWREGHLTYKSVQLPSEPPLVNASVQLKELGDGPHREDALKQTLETQSQNMNILAARLK